MRGERRCWASAVYRCSSLWDHRAEQSPVPRVPMGRCGVKSLSGLGALRGQGPGAPHSAPGVTPDTASGPGPSDTQGAASQSAASGWARVTSEWSPCLSRWEQPTVL